jgi:molybdate transport system substrate-binding protein
MRYERHMPTSPRHSNLAARSCWVAIALIIPVIATACHTDTPREPIAPLRLFGAGATEASVRDEIGAFQTQSKLTVDLTFGAVGALRDKVLAGEPADVVIVTPAIITMLDAQQLVHAGSQVNLGRVGGGLAVKAGTPAPAIGTAEQFKQALLAADEVYYADPAVATAGATLMKVVDSMGIGDQVRAKGHLAPGGKEAMQAMTQSTAAHAVGVTQLSEILSVPEATLVGPYPAELNVAKTVYTAIILEHSERLADAQKLVQFLAGAEFQARLAQSGFEPVPAN